jgi:hypothetical protein
MAPPHKKAMVSPIGIALRGKPDWKPDASNEHIAHIWRHVMLVKGGNVDVLGKSLDWRKTIEANVLFQKRERVFPAQGGDAVCRPMIR